MNAISALYPRLTDRRFLPVYYTPLTLALSLLPFLTSNKRLAVAATFPPLLYLCIRWPCYTTGDAASDYYNNSHFVAIPLWYLDFVLLTPRDGKNGPTYLGKTTATGKKTDERQGQQWRDLSTITERLIWAARLMLPAHRGIGWSWQVKGISTDPYAQLPRWQYVKIHLLWAMFYYVQSVVALFTLGAGYSLRQDSHREARFIVRASLNAIIGWSGAIWVWDRLHCAYSLAAALCVALGVTETWEWPPLMGSLRDAWSVRQMWSVYHQTCRRLFSQPAKRIVRLFGIRQGSLLSSYGQLFITFGISCLFHQAQMFNVTHRDMGELAFFMSQPLAVAAEDCFKWLWRSSSLAGKHVNLERTIGYIWTIAWFSFSLCFYVKGLAEANVMKDWVLGSLPLDKGTELMETILN